MMCSYQPSQLIGIKLCSRRSYRRYSCLICNTILIALFLTIQISQYQSEDKSHVRVREDYCDRDTLRQFYMHDQRYCSSNDWIWIFIDCFSPKELFARDPIRLPFTYELSNGNFCSSNDPPDALIFVISKSVNFDIRTAIRRTWGNLVHLNSISKLAHLRIKLLFLLDIDETLLVSIKLEQSIYQDIVQVHLPERYILSTYRDMAILHWTENYCRNASFTIKTDDDIFLNTFLLANILKRLAMNIPNVLPPSTCSSASHNDPLARIYGILIRCALVVRPSTNPKSEEYRYITTDNEYPCRFYPAYLSGFGYIITRHARVKLLCAFFRVKKLFHLSDVYITGILTDYLNITRQDLAIRITAVDGDDCETFFAKPNTFACASASHHHKQLPSSALHSAKIFERYNTYWNRIYANRIDFFNRFIKV